jgi:hypothetical protein
MAFRINFRHAQKIPTQLLYVNNGECHCWGGDAKSKSNRRNIAKEYKSYEIAEQFKLHLNDPKANNVGLPKGVSCEKAIEDFFVLMKNVSSLPYTCTYLS